MEDPEMGEIETASSETATAAPSSTTPQFENGVVVELPCGYYRDGVLHKHAEFVPMDGGVRKAISKKGVRDDFAKVTDIVLQQCVRRVGSYETTNPKTLGGVLLGDRDFLQMEIRRESMSDKLRAVVTCGACRKKIEVTFLLDEINVTRLEEGDFEIIDDALCFRIRSTDPKLDAICRYPVGTDQETIVEFLDRNPTDAMYRLYTSCLLEWNGKPGPFDPYFLDTQPVKLIDEFSRQFADKKPGPIFDQKVPCPNKDCGTDIEFTFEGSDFFFPLPTRGKT
jgi:hypothetical protein